MLVGQSITVYMCTYDDDATIAINTNAYLTASLILICFSDSNTLGCYYNYNHYSEGDRILTNEPCLNCTCHNKMLMCYLRVCPFTKPIGQDCIIEKREDQCCPIITCPEGKCIWMQIFYDSNTLILLFPPHSSS